MSYFNDAAREGALLNALGYSVDRDINRPINEAHSLDLFERRYIPPPDAASSAATDANGRTDRRAAST